MPSLAEVQGHMRAAILGADADALSGVIAPDRLGHAARLRVYRNNTTILLTDALDANFPIVSQLVGDDFFEGLARAFIRTHPPQSPCLFEYGHDFAAFIETFPGTDAVPYLPDMARLEWAVVEALYAPNAPALNVKALDAVRPNEYARLTFAPHPAARLVRSPFPIHAIWALHQPDVDENARVNLDQGGEVVLVTRPGADVRVERLNPAQGELTAGVLAGRTLGDAFERVHAMHGPDFDPVAALNDLLNGGALQAVRPHAFPGAPQ